LARQSEEFFNSKKGLKSVLENCERQQQIYYARVDQCREKA
jgi:hypothetical protein